MPHGSSHDAGESQSASVRKVLHRVQAVDSAFHKDESTMQ